MTQKEIVINRLREKGFVDNFWSVENKISLRLGAIIHVLRKEGWELHGEFRETNGSEKNFHYIVVKDPGSAPKPAANKPPTLKGLGLAISEKKSGGDPTFGGR